MGAPELWLGAVANSMHRESKEPFSVGAEDIGQEVQENQVVQLLRNSRKKD